jgi:hypothetical protein
MRLIDVIALIVGIAAVVRFGLGFIRKRGFITK